MNRMNPRDIRYTQDTIKPEFQNGRPLDDVINDIKRGKISPDGIEVMDVYQKDGKYYSAGNRRLYVFKRVQESKPYLEVPVNLKSNSRIPIFTTKNDGLSVTIRG